MTAVAELLDQAAAELRAGVTAGDLRITADKLTVLVGLLRRAGQAHGVTVGTEVLDGLDGLRDWAARLDGQPGEQTAVLGVLLDHTARELGDTATIDTVTLGASKLADLLATMRQATQRRHLAAPGDLDGLIRGLNRFALALASSRQPQHTNASATGDNGSAKAPGPG